MPDPFPNERPTFCVTMDCGLRATRYVTCDGEGKHPYCDECADVLVRGGESDLGPVEQPSPDPFPNRSEDVDGPRSRGPRSSGKDATVSDELPGAQQEAVWPDQSAVHGVLLEQVKDAYAEGIADTVAKLRIRAAEVLPEVARFTLDEIEAIVGRACTPSTSSSASRRCGGGRDELRQRLAMREESPVPDPFPNEPRNEEN